MKPVEIYTSPLCGFCHAAKRLLNQKGVSFSEVDVLANPDRKPEMIQRANGGRTVPQIFIGETHVGGCDDLFALEREGKLDGLLAA
ncbi:glutaredoxin 3 [Sulfitobacter porphyrae]|jgi:glutaredoxin 3|uniref:Glutaredoxin n=1 Tax=Sulfitobacter porphyrae TaxID=1246864 RepID=A0ABW2AZI0_9RHOB|nr:glutaredoxin 3 [Sulfitobacter sp. G21635-S1]MCZ4255797.1 glutaredoxin 3 [Sulfitobacter sp. G21635-S1]GLT08622.1 glutaredoxin 3 [Sulfitobacter porphyrae]